MTVDAFEAANPDIKVEWVRDGHHEIDELCAHEYVFGVVKT